MFSECSKLEKLDLFNFDTNNVNDMRLMFNECKLLKELDLSNFEIKGDTYISSMFSYCNDSLKLICPNKKLRKEFDTKNLKNNKLLKENLFV